MTRIIFSVGEIKGQPYRTRNGVKYAIQNTPARDAYRPDVALNNVRIVAEADRYWGGEQSKRYVSPVLNSPTWAQVKAMAATAAKRTGDQHHIFLEGVSITDRVYEGSTVIELSMGS